MKRLATITVIALLQFPLTAMHAQSSTAAAIAPPILPLATSYRYWPIQFVQWIGNELPYSMIELDVDPAAGKHPLLYLTLTERATGKRIHYAESDAMLASANAQGEEAHKAAIAFEAADTDTPGSISTVRLTMTDGKPLQWRFVQGTDLSEQGSGVSPLPDAKIPIIAYREQAAVAGEGTALQIGDTVSTAAVWTEISKPPYFVGYRGAETEGMHMLVFAAGQQTWKVKTAPQSLTPGATWQLDNTNGDHRSIRIDKVDGEHITATSADDFQPGVQFTLEATRSGEGWSIERVRFAPVRDGEKHSLTLQFGTPLSAAADRTAATLIAGKKKTIASGTVEGSGPASARVLSLNFSSPDWLAGKRMSEESQADEKGLLLTARPMKP